MSKDTTGAPVWGDSRLISHRSLASETAVPGLSCSSACKVLSLAILIRYRRVTEGRTDGQTDTGHSTYRACTASRGKMRMWQTSCYSIHHTVYNDARWYTQHTQPFYGPFSGTTRVSRCQKKKSSSELYCARENNRGRHINNPAGRHSIRTNHRPTCTSI